jgi:hypothetical protein
MPKEITSPEEFQKLAEKATECRVKRLGDETKLKIRTSKVLYTIRLDSKAADELALKLTCTKVEV